MSSSGKLSVGWLYDDSLDKDDGVAQYVKTLGAWLSDQGHEVSYLVGSSKLDSWHGGPVYSLSKNMRVRWGGNRMSVPIKPRIKDIKSLLSAKHFDVVHATLPYSPLMAKQVINRLPDSTALVGTWHIYPSNRKTAAISRLLKPAYGRSLKRFDEFISVSAVAQEYAKKIFKSDSDILPNVVDLQHFSSAELTSSSPPKIVFLGRLVKRKGAAYLLEALGYLKNVMDYSDFELVIAGDGPERPKLEQVVRKHGLSHQTRFLGYIDEVDKPKLLASADIACFPSLYGESFGVVLIEAMAAGAGVVLAGDNPGYRGVLHVQPKLLVGLDKDVPVQLAERIRFFLTNEQEARKMHNWQTGVVRRYDVNAVGPQLIDLYARAIAKRRASGHNKANG